MSDSFELYDIEIYIEGDNETFVCSHIVGKAITVIGENLTIHQENGFSMYALSSLLPIIPAKQRITHKNDWITTDALISCPDPYCGAKFRIVRKDLRSFNHSDVTKVSLEGN